MTSRPLTLGEAALARSVFGDAIDYARVTVNRAKWFPFQPPRFVMSPDGHIWVHPRADTWADDYSTARFSLQELFIHEMTHVWQAQLRGRWWLPLMRHPFCRYGYRYVPGRAFVDYGIEQQAEIVRHAWVYRQGFKPTNAPARDLIEPLLPFAGSAAPQTKLPLSSQ